MQLESGLTIADKYRLVRALGRGAFAQTWEAENIVLRRKEALKIFGLHESRARHEYGDDDPDGDEGGLLAEMGKNPNTAMVYDAGFVDKERGVRYLSEELIDGKPLSKTTLSNERQALEILIGVCHGLEFVHSKRIIHHDLKPDNVIIRADGRPIIIDFGSSQGLASGTDPKRGSILYRSPEKIRGGIVDEKSDVWALGVLAYNVLSPFYFESGPHHPFESALRDWNGLSKEEVDSQREEIKRRILNESPRPLPGASRGLERILLRTLDKDPRRRPSVADVKKALIKHQHRYRRRATYTAAAILFPLALVAGTYGATRRASLRLIEYISAKPLIPAELRPKSDPDLDIPLEASRAQFTYLTDGKLVGITPELTAWELARTDSNPYHLATDGNLFYLRGCFVRYLSLNGRRDVNMLSGMKPKISLSGSRNGHLLATSDKYGLWLADTVNRNSQHFADDVLTNLTMSPDGLYLAGLDPDHKLVVHNLTDQSRQEYTPFLGAEPQFTWVQQNTQHSLVFRRGGERPGIYVMETPATEARRLIDSSEVLFPSFTSQADFAFVDLLHRRLVISNQRRHMYLDAIMPGEDPTEVAISASGNDVLIVGKKQDGGSTEWTLHFYNVPGHQTGSIGGHTTPITHPRFVND